jgi:hypothetical protein
VYFNKCLTKKFAFVICFAELEHFLDGFLDRAPSDFGVDLFDDGLQLRIVERRFAHHVLDDQGHIVQEFLPVHGCANSLFSLKLG